LVLDGLGRLHGLHGLGNRARVEKAVLLGRRLWGRLWGRLRARIEEIILLVLLSRGRVEEIVIDEILDGLLDGILVSSTPRGATGLAATILASFATRGLLSISTRRLISTTRGLVAIVVVVIAVTTTIIVITRRANRAPSSKLISAAIVIASAIVVASTIVIPVVSRVATATSARAVTRVVRHAAIRRNSLAIAIAGSLGILSLGLNALFIVQQLNNLLSASTDGETSVLLFIINVLKLGESSNLNDAGAALLDHTLRSILNQIIQQQKSLIFPNAKEMLKNRQRQKQKPTFLYRTLYTCRQFLPSSSRRSHKTRITST
jgi:hypothetical protein